MANGSIGKNWCFTINNWSASDLAWAQDVDCKYIIYGKEKGELGTPHLQGFIVFATNKRLAGVKKVHATAHWEVAKGNSDQNIAYCSKEEDFVERGEKPLTKGALGEREKKRYANAWDKAKEGCFEDIDADIRVRSFATLMQIAKKYMKTAEDAGDVTGEWYYGGPGTGKSRTARVNFPNSYMKMQNKWWDGYQDQETVILDDFDSKELGHHLKIWGDRYAFIAETKGGAINIRPKKIIITSNYHPDEMGWDHEMVEAVKRRYKITKF